MSSTNKDFEDHAPNITTPASGPTVPDYDPSRLQGIFDIPTEHQGEAFEDRMESTDATVSHSQSQGESRTTSTTLTNSSSNQQTTNVSPNAPIEHHYITEEGREAAEDPMEVEAYEKDRKYSDPSTSSDERFEPINANDEGVLRRLASSMRSQSYYGDRRPSLAATEAQDEELERKGTLEGLELTDEVFDPKSPKFDLYKWVRMTLRLFDEEGIKFKRAGITFKNVNVSGTGAALNLQKNVGSMFMTPLRLGEVFNLKKTPRHILHDFNGIMKSGELLIVLGRPGSGCSTFLKTITGQMHGLNLDEGSEIHYNGIPQKQMIKEFKGEVIYNQEVDKHFPHLTVGETLEHAAALRTPQHRPLDVKRQEVVKHVTQVVMAVYGLSHTYNTKVGNDFVRGVSGGERKRVSIAEMALAGSALAAWDNSTRGLDSATALTFVKSLRLTADLEGSAHAIAIYQASQAIYDLFDKAVVLYEGRQIFFGKAGKAKDYFERMGWFCPQRQTTGDFLTSITNPAERQTKEGFEQKVPRTPEEFEQYWKSSPEYAELQKEMADYEQQYPVGSGSELQAFREYKRDAQAKHTRPKSPYVVSVPMQIKLNMKRSWQRIWNDKASTFTPIISNIIMALIIGSVFYQTPDATGGFTAKGATLFFAILLNALAAISEINSLYDQRPIVEKHKSYAFYHPATEAVAGIVLDIPLKFAMATAFNITLYFLAGLRVDAGNFFLFFLINFTSMFVMAAIFRTMAAITKTISQAMALSGVLVLAIVIYTGFVIPVKYMKDWFGWIRWLNPIFYAFEILIANEFHGRRFPCSEFVPAYTDLTGPTFICNTRGAVAGELTVSGDAFIQASYSYTYDHVWRNFGILLGFLFGFMAIYFVAVELNSETTSTAEVLVFRRGNVPKYMTDMAKGKADDEESGASGAVAETEKKGDEGGDVNVIPAQTDIFTWRNVSYDIEIKGEPRRLLDEVSGFVKPGTLTALMGTSGAGKTTLLDVLAQRTTMGVVTGSMFVNGAPLDSSFQRKTGYVQQQDLHLETATVRESLRFSAMLRQPKSVSKAEKYAYVEDVIKMLNMEDFAEAVVGVPGEGLNVEQRKLLTIGVELAAKPKLLLFLDEPTSGLDSQSSWAICAFLRKLADSGQAVLCTIHQPSAILFQEFDRLLFLRKGGKTVYFGNIGENSHTLLDYFERNGARKCDAEENPAEYMLEVVGDQSTDWYQIWKDSPEADSIQKEIEQLHHDKKDAQDHDEDAHAHDEFAMPFTAQVVEVTYRVFQQYWRMPSYILAKMILSGASGLFIGFSFYQANATLQGMQNIVYALFMVTTIFSTIVQQIMPLFVTQRSLYEVRERPSKAYSWVAFLIAQIVVEIPYQIIAGLIVYASFYYPVVGAGQSSERQGLVLLLCVVFFIYASTFAHMCIAALPDAQTAGAIVTFLFAMSLIFNGVMQAPQALPGFWIFMYRVSPMTYWVSGMASTMLHDRQVSCSQDEINQFQPPSGQTCGAYMQPYLQQAPGYLLNPDASSDCQYCSISVADTFLAGSEIYWSERWRNFGLMWAYVAFNIGAVVVLYYFFRVRTGSLFGFLKKGKSKKSAPAQPSETAQADENNKEVQQNENVEQEQEQQPRRKSIVRAPTWTGVASTAQNYANDYMTYNLGRVHTNRRNAQII
ncbi:ABC multidrug transporter atrI [Pseudocercospora fuligena]|uniref:ABC multidrug transporter atrI n=1 Tax=Pseudocercospora fuligena TaxID=685502 RepID=A0A8H6RVY0_9PEZI|nr:ABC multidrug transporter atrI [Pseudocercospora fuligena]